MPGGSPADNNVAQKPNTPLNPLSGPAGVSYQVPSGLSTLCVPARDNSTPFHFALNGAASITNLEPLLYGFLQIVNSPHLSGSLPPFCLQSKVDVAGHCEEGDAHLHVAAQRQMPLQRTYSNVSSCMSSHRPEIRELMDEIFHIVSQGLAGAKKLHCSVESGNGITIKVLFRPFFPIWTGTFIACYSLLLHVPETPKHGCYMPLKCTRVVLLSSAKPNIFK